MRFDDELRGLSRWRARAGAATLAVVVGVALAAVAPGPRSEAWALFLLGAALLVFVLAAVGTLVGLHRFARFAGGARYAASQTLLALVLTPVAGLGVWLVPLLVVSDAEKGIAEWRRATRPPLGRSALETYLLVVSFAAVAALPATLGMWGLLLAIVLLFGFAALVKRLLGSSLRPTGEADPDGR